MGVVESGIDLRSSSPRSFEKQNTIELLAVSHRGISPTSRIESSPQWTDRHPNEAISITYPSGPVARHVLNKIIGLLYFNFGLLVRLEWYHRTQRSGHRQHMASDTSSAALRHGLAVAFVAAAVAARLGLEPILGRNEDFLVFTLAILATVRFGGRAAALTATTLSVLFALIFFTEPRYSFAIANPRDAGSLVLLAASGVGIAFLASMKAKPRPDAPDNSGRIHHSAVRRTALLAGVFLVLVVLTRLLYADFEREKDRQYWVAHTYQALNEVQNVMHGLDQAETEERGFLLTGESRTSSGAFESAIRAGESAQHSLMELTSENPGQTERLSELHRLNGKCGSRVFVKAFWGGPRQVPKRFSSRFVRVRIHPSWRIVARFCAPSRKTNIDCWLHDRKLPRRTRCGSVGCSVRRQYMLALLILCGAVIEQDSQKRERDRRAIQTSEERLHFALDSANAGTWEWDLENNENVWSEELWKLYRFRAAQLQAIVRGLAAGSPSERPRQSGTGGVRGCASRRRTECGVPRGFQQLPALGTCASAPVARCEWTGATLPHVLDIPQRKEAERRLLARAHAPRFTEVAPVAIADGDRARYVAASERFPARL